MGTMIEELERLSDSQRQLLQEFREEVKDVLTSEHDDVFLLRFLKAREFNVTEAGSMLRKTLEWRREIGADTVLKDYEIPEIIRKKMPSRFMGFDKDGRGVRYIFLGKTDFKSIVASVSIFDIVKSSIAMYEHDLEQMKMNNEKTGRHTDTFTIIQDWKGLSIAQFASKKVVEGVMESVKAFDANYPERIYRMAVIRAPSVFSVVYGLMKPLLSETTRAKVMFLDGDGWKVKLMNLVGENNLPKYLGGSRDVFEDDEDEEDSDSRRGSKSSNSA